MINIAICDDEKIFVKKLQRIISGYLEKNQLEYKIDCFYSGEELVELGINMSQYNILFLDIEIGSFNGIDIAKSLRRFCVDSYIVLVTAFAKYSIDGYYIDTTRYILKNDPNFIGAVEESVSSIMKKMRVDTEIYSFDFKECKKNINLNRIVYIESMLHNLYFCILEDDYIRYSLRAPISKYEELLKDKGFIRVQQSFLVNWKYIKRINSYVVELKNGTKIMASKKNYKEIKMKYAELKGGL